MYSGTNSVPVHANVRRDQQVCQSKPNRVDHRTWSFARFSTQPCADRPRISQTMAEHNDAERAWIRDYAPADEKEVRFMLAQSQMEYLAFANNRCAFFHHIHIRHIY